TTTTRRPSRARCWRACGRAAPTPAAHRAGARRDWPPPRRASARCGRRAGSPGRAARRRTGRPRGERAPRPMSAARRPAPEGGALAWIEALGNRLPDPVTLFALGTLAVMALSQVAVARGWSVEKTVVETVRAPVRGPDGHPVLDP